MDTDQIMSAIFLVAVLALILPSFLSTNNKLKEFFLKFINLDYNYTYNYCSYLFSQIMKKINLAISGCMGRMGQQLIKSARKDSAFNITSITEDKKINKKIFGIKPQPNSSEAFKKAKVIIDFTVPKCTLEILRIAAKERKRVVIGTTGFSKMKKI